MNFLNLYINFIRIILVVISIYYIYKRNFKFVKSTGIVFVLTFLLNFLDMMFNIKVDSLGSFLYITIIVMSIYLGSSLKFYDKYWWWDRLIHFLSGITIVNLGVVISNKVDNLSNFNILLFSFTLSLSLHLIWEVIEYISDSIFHTNHQRWQKVNESNNHISKSDIQPAGLVDTMKDSIMCILGSIASCIVWWFVL